MLKGGRLKRGEEEGRWCGKEGRRATGKGEKRGGLEIMIGGSEEEGRKCKAEEQGVNEGGGKGQRED